MSSAHRTRRIARAIAVVSTAASIAVSPPASAATGPAHNVTFKSPPLCSSLCWDVSGDRCGAPLAPLAAVTYDVFVTVPATESPGFVPSLMTVGIAPVVDYDLVVCRIDGGPPRHEGHAATAIDVPCGTGLPLGCAREVSVPVAPGQTFALRAYAGADPFEAPGFYRFSGPGA